MPLEFIAAAALWVAAGTTCASVLYLRGHDGRAWLVLGALAGPLTALLMADQVRFVEPDARTTSRGSVGAGGTVVLAPMQLVPAFTRDSLRNGKLWTALAGVVVLQVVAVHVGPVQELFGTTDLTAVDWLVATAVASTVLWVEEARKALTRGRRKR